MSTLLKEDCEGAHIVYPAKTKKENLTEQLKGADEYCESGETAVEARTLIHIVNLLHDLINTRLLDHRVASLISVIYYHTKTNLSVIEIQEELEIHFGMQIPLARLYELLDRLAIQGLLVGKEMKTNGRPKIVYGVSANGFKVLESILHAGDEIVNTLRKTNFVSVSNY